MKANMKFENYELLRDYIEAVGHVTGVREQNTKKYSLQRELYDYAKDRCYNDDNSLKSRVDFGELNAGEYRDNFGWELDAVENYREVPKDFLPKVLHEIFPRVDEDSTRGPCSMLRLPTHNGNTLPVVVDTEAELKEAKHLIDARFGFGNDSNSEPKVESTGLSEVLQEFSGIGSKNSKEIAQQIQNQPELAGAILDELEYVENYEITNDPIKRFSGEQREMAESLREQGFSDRQIISQLA